MHVSRDIRPIWHLLSGSQSTLAFRRSQIASDTSSADPKGTDGTEGCQDSGTKKNPIVRPEKASEKH